MPRLRRRGTLAVPVAGVIVLASIILMFTSVTAQPPVDVTFRVTVPAETPAHDPVYIAGSFQGWDPGAPAYRLTEVGGNLYEITLTFDVGASIEFKFTRGDWLSVEKGPGGEEIPNRQAVIDSPGTLEFAVARWRDLTPGSTITGDVTLLTVPDFLNGRRVWIYLPPGYHEETAERYPVLYMLDGQNVFDAATSFASEWRVDETCEELIPAGEIRPIIVVAVANGEVDRGTEYTPWYDSDRGFGGGGAAHIQEFVDVLLPWVNANYRTLTGREHTGLSGSSLGGLLPLYTAYAQAQTFGLIGALSPTVFWADYELLNWTASHPRPDSRVYMDMGTLEAGVKIDEDQNGIDDFIDALRLQRDAMLAQGFVLDDDLKVVEDEGANHNEAFWAARFPEALKFLFPPEQVATEKMSFGRFKARFPEGS